MKKINRQIQEILLLLGLIGMTLFGLNWHVAIAAWLTPIVLLRYTRDVKAAGFFGFVLIAIGVGVINRSCLSVYSPPVAYVINGVFFGLSYSAAYLIDRFFYKKNNGFYTTLIYPAAVVLIEYLTSFYIGTWGTVAHTQYPVIQLTQIVSVTGLFGLSFLVSWFGSTVNWMYENWGIIYTRRKSITTYGGMILLVLIYGQIRINSFPTYTKTVSIAAITSNPGLQNVFEEDFEVIKTFAEKATGEIPERIYSNEVTIEKAIENTLKAVQQGAKIIVWNEYALILNQYQVAVLIDKIKEIATQNKVYILLAFLEENTTSEPKPLNNKSLLITQEGKIGWEYLKSFLMPQSEGAIINPGNFQVPFLDTKYGRLGNVVCYDGDIPKLTRQGGQQSVDIMLIPAYDWEAITPYHAQMASFTAIENGYSLVRTNGNGLVAAYDYQGKVIGELNTFKTDANVLYADVPIDSTTTIYAKVGDIFVHLCIVLLLIIFGGQFIKLPKTS